MAVEAPDARAFKSWEDAFQYPIPAVRGMEKKLRSSLEENHDKLRSLVGASYRDLLGTARTIVEVNAQTQKVETLLGLASRKCDSRVFERIGENYARFDHDSRAQDQDRFAIASQLSVLQASLNVVSTLLRSTSSSLLGAKLLVICRLLHKTLSQTPNCPKDVESLGQRRASLHQKLLRHINKRLARADIDESVLVEDMTAWSLVTSSTPSDILKHFQHLRLTALGTRTRHVRQSTKAFVLSRLDLFLTTLKQSQTIFPELLQASLRSLGTKPLLKDQTILALDELNLDIHERWFSSDVRNYTPWSRHDELDRQTAESIRKGWADEALTSLEQVISSCIEEEADLHTLTDVRNETLQTWLTSKSSAKQLDSRSVLDQLRQVFTMRQKSLIQATFSNLEDSICKRIVDTLSLWNNTTPSSYSQSSLWDLPAQSMEISDGAAAFRQQILDRRVGQTDIVTNILHGYTVSAKKVSEIPRIIKRMRDTRWEDDYDDDAYDEDDPDSVWQVLSRSDPDELQSHLHETAQQSFQRMESGLTTACKDSFIDCSSANATGLTLLRLLRELRHRLPRILNNISKDIVQMPFCPNLLDVLQISAANAISDKSGAVFSKTLTIWIRSPKRADALWEGKPPLPIQPSPPTFRYLRRVVRDMEALGSDLWSPDLVDRLKEAITTQVEANLKAAIKQLDAISAVDETLVNGTNETDPAVTSEDETPELETDDKSAEAPEQADTQVVVNEGNESTTAEPAGDSDAPAVESSTPGKPVTQLHEKTTQLLFDTLYLQQAFALSEEAQESSSLFDTVAVLTSKANLDDASNTRIQKNAAEYWRRTYLLFGLLAT